MTAPMNNPTAPKPEMPEKVWIRSLKSGELSVGIRMDDPNGATPYVPAAKITALQREVEVAKAEGEKDFRNFINSQMQLSEMRQALAGAVEMLEFMGADTQAKRIQIAKRILEAAKQSPAAPEVKDAENK